MLYFFWEVLIREFAVCILVDVQGVLVGWQGRGVANHKLAWVNYCTLSLIESMSLIACAGRLHCCYHLQTYVYALIVYASIVYAFMIATVCFFPFIF